MFPGIPTMPADFTILQWQNGRYTSFDLFGSSNAWKSLQTFSAGLTVSGGSVTLPAASIADAALSANVGLLSGNNTWTATQTFNAIPLFAAGAYFTGATLPAQVSGTPLLTGGFASPNSGRLFIGDGTGWNFNISKRLTSTTTDLFTFNDTGNFGIGIIPTAGFHLASGKTALLADSTASTSTTTGALVVTGGAGFGGNITLDGASGKTIRYANPTANAAVAVTLGSVGPTGSTAGNPQGWLRVSIAGTDRYIPFW